MSLRPPQESYQGIRSAWNSEGPPRARFRARGAGLAAGPRVLRPLATVASHSRRNAARRRRHEFGADRVADRRGEDAIDLPLGPRIELADPHLVHPLPLAGA